MPDKELRCPVCKQISADPDDCSNCGASMASSQVRTTPPAPVSEAPAGVVGETACPVCSLGRPSSTARFCPVCRYDYKLHKAYDVPPPDPVHDAEAAALPDSSQAEPPTADAPPDRVPAYVSPPPFDATTGLAYDLLVKVDLSLRSPDDPMPTDLRERVFPLDYDDHLIGRRSDKDNIHPEIILPDAGASKRHARLTREADGTMSLMDVGSMNGTMLNGKPMTPNVKYPVTPADDICLGCWSRLKLQLR